MTFFSPSRKDPFCNRSAILANLTISHHFLEKEMLLFLMNLHLENAYKIRSLIRMLKRKEHRHIFKHLASTASYLRD